MMVAAVDTKQAFHSETPRRLFDGHFTGAGHAPHFDVAVDGKRFVMVRSDDASLLTQLTVVQNWFEDLKRLVPLK